MLNTLDLRKRRVMDLQQNLKVFLPPPLNPMLESGLSIRKQEHLNTFSDYVNNNCDEMGRQVKTSLSKHQRKGLQEIRRRTKEGEVVILESDKTGKFSVVTSENYLEMGKNILREIKS